MPKKGGANVNNGNKINNLSNANIVAKNMINNGNGNNGNGNGNVKVSNGNNGKSVKKDYTIVIITVVVVIVVAILSYLAYRYIKNRKLVGIRTKELVPYIHDGKLMARFSFGSIPVGTERNSYNYNFWVYINDYDYRSGEDKCLLFKGLKTDSVHNLDTNENPGVYLLKNTNTLRVLINLETKYDLDDESCSNRNEERDEDNSNEIAISSSDPLANNLIVNETFVGHHSNDNIKSGCDHCDIKHFPLQKWVSVNVAVTNNVLDVSIDGKLVKSCVLTGSPKVNDNDLLLCPEGGFNGFVSNLKASSKAISVEDIEKIYKRGPTLKPGILN